MLDLGGYVLLCLEPCIHSYGMVCCADLAYIPLQLESILFMSDFSNIAVMSW